MNLYDNKNIFFIFLHIFFKIILVSTCISGYCSLNAIGQRSDQYIGTHITLPDVYSSRSIYDVLLDQAGIIWIANLAGLYFYDGVQAQPYTNKNISPEKWGSIYQLAEDANQNLWLITQNGLYILDKHREKLINTDALQIPASIVQSSNLGICQGENNDIFIFSNNSIFIYRQNKIKQWSTYNSDLFPQNSRPIIFYSKKEAQIYLYFASHKLCVCREDGNITTSWREKTIHGFGRENSFSNTYLTFTNAFSDSVTIFEHLSLTKSSQVYLNHRTRTYTISLSDNPPNSLPLLEFYKDLKYQQKQTFNAENVGGPRFHKLSRGILAVTSTEGILLLKKLHPKFHFFETTTGQRVRAIQEDKYDHIIFGSYNGTMYFDKKTGQLHQLYNKTLCAWVIQPITPDKDHFIMEGEDLSNTLYFLQSSPQGVRISKKLEHVGKDSLQGFNTSMSYDKALEGMWHWVNPGHLAFYDIKTETNHIFDQQKIRDRSRAMIKHEDLWICNSTIQRFSNFNLDSKTYDDISHTIPEKVRKIKANALYIDINNNLWIGTNAQGLARYNIKTNEYDFFSTTDGIAENTVYSITAEPGDSVLWLGTGNGLSRFSVSQRWFDNYYTEDGLSDNEFNTASTYQAPDGTIYLGGQNGINYFHRDSFDIHPQLPKLYAILRLSQLGQPDNNNHNLLLYSGSSLEIEPSVQLIEINFRTDEYFQSARTQYRYRVPGIIDNWQYLNYSDKALFPKIPAGTHIIEVQSKLYRGMWCPSTKFYLTILPRWYETWWFRVILALAIAAAGYGLYNLRLRQLRREFDLRQQISHDLHDSLGSRIYLLRSLSHQITNPLSSESDKKAQLERLEAISQDTFKSIRDFIWAFDPKQDGIKSLFDRMDDFAENYLSPLVKNVHITKTPLVEEMKIGPRQKHHLMNVYQEILTNIVKHTHAVSIHIELTTDYKTIVIQIQNQHAGFKASVRGEDNSHKMGKQNIQHRLAEIDGELEWEEPDEQQQVIIIKSTIA